MPNLDGTGPRRQGTGNGFGRGVCANQGMGRRMRCGRGRGLGRCASSEEKTALLAEKERLTESLAAVEQRLEGR